MKPVYRAKCVWFGIIICFYTTAHARHQINEQSLSKTQQLLTLYRHPTLGTIHQQLNSAGVIPAGLNLRHKVTSHWDVSFLLEYDFVGLGTSSPSHQHEWTQEIIDMRARQAEGQGVLAAIQFIGNYLEQDFVIQPYYRLWDVQGLASNHVPTSNALPQPDNDPGQEIHEYGIHLTWRF